MRWLALLLTLGLPSGLVAQETETRQDFVVDGIEAYAEGDLGSYELAVDTEQIEPGLSIATLRLSSPEAAVPQPLTIALSFPSHDVHGVWTTGAQFNKSLGPDWYPSTIQSTMTRHAPVIALFGADDGNRLTLAVSEALHPVTLTAGVREEDARVYARIELFGERRRAAESIEIELRLDRRAVSLETAPSEMSRTGGPPGRDSSRHRSPIAPGCRCTPPGTATTRASPARPFSSEIRVGKELGFEAIIIDDGWQTLDSQRGYRLHRRLEAGAHAGDEGLRRRGPRARCGCAALVLPAVGRRERRRSSPRFESKYLRHWEEQGSVGAGPPLPGGSRAHHRHLPARHRRLGHRRVQARLPRLSWSPTRRPF